MAKRDALVLLFACCRLSPPAESGVEKQTAPNGILLGHMILPKEEPLKGILGAIYFSDNKVVRMTRSLDNEVDTPSDDVVAFAREINRALSPTVGDANARVHVS